MPQELRVSASLSAYRNANKHKCPRTDQTFAEVLALRIVIADVRDS